MAEMLARVGQTISEKAVTEAGKSTRLPGESEFAKVLSERIEKPGEMTKQIFDLLGFSPGKRAEVKAVSAEGLEIRTAQVSAQQEIRSSGKVMDILADVNRGAGMFDHMVERLSSGPVSMQECLSIQVGVQKIALELETTRGIVEQANSSFQKTIQQPIGG